MKLFAGLSRTDYQDILRALGAIMNARGLRDVRIWEYETASWRKGGNRVRPNSKL